jgi:predicted N-acetyltransferase YhbS
MNMNIREATIDDAKGLLYHVKAVLGSRTFTLTTLDELKQSEDTQLEMKQQKNLILVAEDNGRIIGDLIFFGGSKYRNSHTGEFALGVQENYRGQGVGKVN